MDLIEIPLAVRKTAIVWFGLPFTRPREPKATLAISIQSRPKTPLITAQKDAFTA